MRRLRFVLVYFLLVTSSGFAQTPSEDLFQKGLAAYQNKQFTEARDFFNQVLAEGVESASLYHDLALTHFQMDQKPYAMAYWRKALAVDPDFPLALAGRQYMETKFNMRPWEKDSAALWIRRTMDWVSYYQLLWVLAVLIGVTGWLWIGYIAARKVALEDEQPKPAFPTLATTLSTVFLAVIFLIGYKAKLSRTVRATIVLDKVQARSLPSDDGVGLFDLNGGSEVIVRRNNGDWLQVQNSDGASGWVKRTEALEAVQGAKL